MSIKASPVAQPLAPLPWLLPIPEVVELPPLEGQRQFKLAEALTEDERPWCSTVPAGL